MKRLGKRTDVEELCVLRARNADMDRTGRFRDYIAFGNWTDSNEGPAIWFHGGTPFSGCLGNAPVMHFNIYGDCSVAPAMWMTESICPNVFNKEYLEQLTAFIQSNLPILYLVYERCLDKEDALAYFEGRMDWKEMLSSVYNIKEDLYAGLVSCANNAQLHMFCVRQQIYGKHEALVISEELLCGRLKKQQRPTFELLWEDDGYRLCKYNGDSEVVYIPENVQTIGESAFAGHREIRKILFSKDVQNIEKGAFGGCSGISVLTFPADIWVISRDAFAGCTGLQTVCFEEPYLHELFLEEGAFRNCKSLSDIFLSPQIILAGHPFGGCPYVVIHCRRGSPEEEFARENDIRCICED